MSKREKREKKPFRETKLGEIVNKAKDFIPDAIGIGAKVATGNFAGAFNDVKNALTGVEDPVAKECLNELELNRLEIMAELEKVELEEVTKRWEIDMNSDSWLSKNIRPLVVLWLVVFVSVFAVIDSVEVLNVTVDKAWISLFGSLLITVIVAYFGSRGYEKGAKLKFNNKK